MSLRKSITDELWRRGELGYKLWPQQRPIYEDIRKLTIQQTTTIVVECARQFGKSYLGVLLAFEDCIQNPNSTVIIVGPTIKQTTDIVYQGVRKIQDDAPEGMVKRTKSESRWHIGSSDLIVGGFDVQNATRQRGKTLYKIYVEELVDSNPDDYDDAIKSDLGPALTHSPCGQIIYLTTPPKIPDHPFLTETVPEAILANSFYKYTIDDNEQLTEDQYNACVKRCGGKDTVDFQREYMCEVVRDKSILVTPNFVKDRHVRDDLTYPQKGFYQLTIDWGGVRDKTCVIFHVYDFLMDRLLVLDESVHDANTATSTIIRKSNLLIEKHGKVVFQNVVDCPGQLQVDLRDMHDFHIVIPPKSDWRSACNNLDVGFVEDKILIHPRCKYVIENCNSGMFNKQRTDFERTRALGHCDGLAALMYAYRTQNRENPWPKSHGGVPLSSNMMHFPKQADEGLAAISKAMSPRRFGR